MIHSFRLSARAITVFSALAITGLAPGLPAPAHAADGQPVPVQPRWKPEHRPKGLVGPARPVKAEKARKKRKVRRQPVEVRRPRVRLDVGGPEGPLVPGRSYDWPYSITNLGPRTAEGVFFRTPVPGGLEYVSGQGNCSMQGPYVVCAVGSLQQHQTHTGVITTRVSEHATPASTVQGSVEVKWTGGTTTGSFPATSISQASDLVVTANGPGQVQAGHQITYTFTVENRGPSAATGVTVNAPGTSTQTPVTVVGGQNCAAQGDQGVVCTLGTVGAHTSKTFTVVFKATPKATPGAIFVRRFEVVSSTPDLHPDDNYATVRPTVIRYLPTRDRDEFDDEFPDRPRPRPMPRAPRDEAPREEAPAPAPEAPAPAPRTAVEALPETGSDTQSRVDLALALLGTGLVLVGVAARRRRASSGRTGRL
ncbi:hypothetical protein ABGB12_14610 [Actinocorallia sp. B10E7]|uniref:hypothetical protein n=1 Tax=Actinocorallia sp. B10E7 TaxID=3153558 RepID=UPI00325C5875